MKLNKYMIIYIFNLFNKNYFIVKFCKKLTINLKIFNIYVFCTKKNILINFFKLKIKIIRKIK